MICLDSGYKLAHTQSVCTRPFFPRRERPGDEARFNIVTWSSMGKIFSLLPCLNHVTRIAAYLSHMTSVTVRLGEDTV